MRNQDTSPGPAIESKIRRLLPVLHRWYRDNRRPLPWRVDPTPYRTAVAEFMCQQTRVATVIPYYRRWMRIFPGWRGLARSSTLRILRLWEGLGYYRRARNLHSLARAVLRLPGQELPDDVESLRKLPGIGDYTAGAIASIAFKIPSPAFDANVARVLGRLTAKGGRSPRLPYLRCLAGKIVPQKDPGLHNQSLMELGALICLPRNPLCASCPLKSRCPSSRRIPGRPKPPPPVPLRETILLVKWGQKIWVTREHPRHRWKGLFLLPTVPGKPRTPRLLTIRYPFTRYRIQADVHLTNQPPAGIKGKWMCPGELRRAPFPSPHRKILRLAGRD